MRKHILENVLHPFRREFTGRYAARSVYGTIVVLALLLAVQPHSPGPLPAAALVVGTLLAILGAEAYSEVLGAEVELRRRLDRVERLERYRDLGLMFAAAVWPVAFLLLAAVGALEEDTAFNLGIWLSIAMLFVYGFLARRLSRASLASAVVSAAVLGFMGLLLAAFKSALH